MRKAMILTAIACLSATPLLAQSHVSQSDGGSYSGHPEIMRSYADVFEKPRFDVVRVSNFLTKLDQLCTSDLESDLRACGKANRALHKTGMHKSRRLQKQLAAHKNTET